VFAGADEVAEIAYLTLQETDLKLAGVVDMENTDALFFSNKVMPIETILQLSYDRIVVTSYLKHDALHKELLKNGIDKDLIRNFTTI
jgi:hypothetical protein